MSEGAIFGTASMCPFLTVTLLSFCTGSTSPLTPFFSPFVVLREPQMWCSEGSRWWFVVMERWVHFIRRVAKSLFDLSISLYHICSVWICNNVSCVGGKGLLLCSESFGSHCLCNWDWPYLCPPGLVSYSVYFGVKNPCTKWMQLRSLLFIVKYEVYLSLMV